MDIRSLLLRALRTLPPDMKVIDIIWEIEHECPICDGKGEFYSTAGDAWYVCLRCNTPKETPK